MKLASAFPEVEELGIPVSTLLKVNDPVGEGG